MKIKCKYCGEYFWLNKEDQELFEQGEINKPDTCQSCFNAMEQYDKSFEEEDHFLGDCGS